MSDTSNLKQTAKLIWQRLKDSKQSLSPQRRAAIIERLQSLPHKTEVNPKDWERVKPNLLLIAEFLVNLCEDLGLPILFSSIIRPGIPGVSISLTHEQGRAFDISIMGWPKKIAAYIAELINDAFEVGAISFSDGKEREAVYEDGKSMGTAPCLHFQVRHE